LSSSKYFSVDRILSTQTTTLLGVFLGLGDGSFQAPSWFSTPEAENAILVADLDNDGRSSLYDCSTDTGFELEQVHSTFEW